MDGKQRKWDEYFMDIAEVVAKKSKDPSTKNGCVIVDSFHRPVSFGYNGWIQGADESKMTWDERPMKYYFSIHSEMNAMIFAKRDLTGCTLYNVYATCENCLKFLLQAGITRFVYRRFRVESKMNKAAGSMNDEYSDEAIVRLLRSMPGVETLNLANGKTYIDEIVEWYEPGSQMRKKLEGYL
ncbi:MAG: hypothetical protein LBO78_00415 [Rickettsiales bacterium]|jgi:dCMP deaminase|nr:hypothetical protein [Rickettsiales bacterium]